MIELYNGELADILPGQMAAQTQQQCISYALKKGIQLVIDRANETRTQAVIDSLPEKILDVLAVELRTPYYREDMDTHTKRNIIKRTLLWHLTAGTPRAVSELIATVFGDGEVVEWFDYGDKPYHFKVKTNALLTPEMSDFFTSMLERVKNTRSHLRMIEIHRTAHCEVFTGAAVLPCYRPAAVIDGYSVARGSSQMIYSGAAEIQQNHPAAITDGFQEERGTAARAFAGVGEASQIHPSPIINTMKQEEK